MLASRLPVLTERCKCTICMVRPIVWHERHWLSSELKKGANADPE